MKVAFVYARGGSVGNGTTGMHSYASLAQWIIEMAAFVLVCHSGKVNLAHNFFFFYLNKEHC